MSRIGKASIKIPKGVLVDIKLDEVSIKGKKGAQTYKIHPLISVEKEADELFVKANREGRKIKALWGLTRALIKNSVLGVSEGYTKTLSIVGVGYRAVVDDGVLKLSLGYSHDILYQIPQDIKVTCDKNTQIVVEGANKHKVGQVCADIRKYRVPEPYKGKGIRYIDEIVQIKEGKKK